MYIACLTAMARTCHQAFTLANPLKMLMLETAPPFAIAEASLQRAAKREFSVEGEFVSRHGFSRPGKLSNIRTALAAAGPKAA